MAIDNFRGFDPCATLLFKVITRTEKDAQVLVFSEGSVTPVALTAEMSLMQVTAELVKVKMCSKDGFQVHIRTCKDDFPTVTIT